MNVMNVSRRVPGKLLFIVPTGSLRETFITFITFSLYRAMRQRDWERPVTATREDNSEVHKLLEDLLADWFETTISPASAWTIKGGLPGKTKVPGR
jgi:hypothetical protein